MIHEWYDLKCAFILLIWPSLEARAEILTKKVHILGDWKTPKFPSEINWPLAQIQTSVLDLFLDIWVAQDGVWFLSGSIPMWFSKFYVHTATLMIFGQKALFYLF